MNVKSIILTGALGAALLAPGLAGADPGEVVKDPFGNLTMSVLAEPNGIEPGKARLTIVTANGQVTASGDRVFFGLRIMGSEGMRMTGFRLTGTGNCIVSDFAGENSAGGWQGATAFGTEAPGLGSVNQHMRMIGGAIRKSCGNIQIDVTFPARPLVAFYGAFFGSEPAPWHDNYDEAPWGTVPTGGTASYQNWWDLWGTFDTLGYSNACTSISGTDVSCG